MSVKYNRVVVGLQFREKVHGGVPLHKDAADYWMNKLALTDEQRQELTDTIERLQNQAVGENEEAGGEQKEVEKALIGFHSDDVGLYVKDITFKAHLKDMFSRLGIFMKTSGKNEVRLGLQIRPERVRFVRDGQIITAPDEMDIGIVHVQVPGKGRQSALRYGHVIVEPSVELSVFILCPFKRVTVEHIEQAFNAGQENGYGANRTIGYGRYKVTKFEDKGKVEVALGQELTHEAETEQQEGQAIPQEATQLVEA